jgi:hypothetical protein
LLYLGTKFDENGKSIGKYRAQLTGLKSADYDALPLKQYLSQPKRKSAKQM